VEKQPLDDVWKWLYKGQKEKMRSGGLELSPKEAPDELRYFILSAHIFCKTQKYRTKKLFFPTS